MNNGEGMFWILMGLMLMLSMGFVGLIIIIEEAKERIKKIGWKAYKKEQKEKIVFCTILSIIITTTLFLINQYVFPIYFIDVQINPCHYPNMTGALC